VALDDAVVVAVVVADEVTEVVRLEEADDV
jgi:hypothetical protein